MEHERAGADEEVANKGYEEDAVMFVAYTVYDALDPEIEEHEIGKGIDDFGGVYGGVVVLVEADAISVQKGRNSSTTARAVKPTNLFTPV